MTDSKDHADEKRLVKAAKELTVELRKKLLPQAVVWVKSKLFSTDSDGWGIVIAKWSAHPGLELWFDRYLDINRRHFWFGFVAGGSKRHLIKSLVDAMPDKLQPRVVLTDDSYERKEDLVGKSKHVDVLKKNSRPSTQQIRNPIIEIYKGNAHFYGMYDDRSDFDVSRAAIFIGDVVNAVSDFQADYPGANEGKEIVVRHIRLERDPSLALARKRKDKFCCQVCRLNYYDPYKTLNQKVMEAHHTIPLNKLRRPRVNHLSDLITVCANCHRVLHGMSGRPDDIAKLRRSLARGKIA